MTYGIPDRGGVLQLLSIPEFGIFLQCSQKKAVYGRQLTFCLDCINVNSHTLEITLLIPRGGVGYELVSLFIISSHVHIVRLSLTLFFLRFCSYLDKTLHKGGSWDPDNRNNTDVWLP